MWNEWPRKADIGICRQIAHIIQGVYPVFNIIIQASKWEKNDNGRPTLKIVDKLQKLYRVFFSIQYY